MRVFSGAWYGYFASDEIHRLRTDSSQLTDTDTSGDSRDGEDSFGLLSQLNRHSVDAPTPNPNNDVGLPLQTSSNLYDLDGEFDVVYEKAAGEQTVTLELDDPDSGVSLDRSNYPQNTGVAVTIDDQAMNVDPTGEDTWFLIAGSMTERYTAYKTTCQDRD